MKILKYLFILLLFSNLNADEEVVKEKKIFLKLENKIEKVFINQIVPIEIKAIVAAGSFDDIKCVFENGNDVKILNPDNPWRMHSANIFTNRFLLKFLDKKANIPTIKVILYKNEKLIDTAILKTENPNIVKLPKNNDFCGVFANSLKVVEAKSNMYDNDNQIVVLEIEANSANLEDFNLTFVKKSGIDEQRVDFPYSKIYYFAVVPKRQKEMHFSYFNLLENRLNSIDLSIEFEKERLSTQTELNPKKSTYYRYKVWTVAAIFILLLLFYAVRRKKIYIFFMLIFGIYLYNLSNPINKITLKQGCKVTILPTLNSTIFYTPKSDITVERLDKRGEWIKVLLPDSKIGWVKRDDTK